MCDCSEEEDMSPDVLSLPTGVVTPGQKRADIVPANFEIEGMPRTCYTGQLWCDDTSQFLMACDSKGHWKRSATCGKLSNGIGCCKLSGVSPSCDCGNEQPPSPTEVIQPSAAVDTASLNLRAPSLAKEIDPTAGEGPCTPGQRMCSIWQRWSIKCDEKGKWQAETDCGFLDPDRSYGCCKDTYSGPVCDCHWQAADEHAPSARSDSIADREAEEPVEVAEGAADCNPGDYVCSGDNRWIFVCGGDGRYAKSAGCGRTSAGYSCCRESADKQAFCDCRSLPGSPPALQA